MRALLLPKRLPAAAARSPRRASAPTRAQPIGPCARYSNGRARGGRSPPSAPRLGPRARSTLSRPRGRPRASPRPVPATGAWRGRRPTRRARRRAPAPSTTHAAPRLPRRAHACRSVASHAAAIRVRRRQRSRLHCSCSARCSFSPPRRAPFSGILGRLLLVALARQARTWGQQP